MHDRRAGRCIAAYRCALLPMDACGMIAANR
jgi:hypothetical protein